MPMRSTLLNADQLDGHVIAAVPLVGEFYQTLGGGMQAGVVAHYARHFSRGKSAMQPVGAQQQHVAGENLVLAGIHAHEQIVSKRPAQNVACFGPRGFLGRHHADPYLIVDHGVIPRERRRQAAADQVTTRISHVRDGCPVEAQRACDHRGRHGNSARPGRHPGLVDAHVGGLHQTRQYSRLGLAGRGAAKSFEHALDGGARGDFSQVLAAYAVGQREQPAM